MKLYERNEVEINIIMNKSYDEKDYKIIAEKALEIQIEEDLMSQINSLKRKINELESKVSDFDNYLNLVVEKIKSINDLVKDMRDDRKKNFIGKSFL